MTDKSIKEQTMIDVLKRAQEVYGLSNQVSVTAEECCELAMVCNKYVRYPTHEKFCEKMREKLIEELADVVICINHLRIIFGITTEEEHRWIVAKLNRLQGWLDTNDSFYQTTIDRTVELQDKDVRSDESEGL